MQSGYAKSGILDPVSFGIRSAVGLFSRPLNGMFDSVGDFGRRLGEGDRLAAENEALRARLNAMSLYEEQIDTLQGQIANLRTLSNMPAIPGHDRVMADVTDFAQYEGRLTLSRGKESGIRPNMPVISSDGLVAIVQTVWNGGCQAALITNASVMVGGLDLSRKPPIEGLVKGRDPSTLVLTLFDPNAPAQMGDTVVTSGHSERIPRLLRIGKVIAVENDIDYGIRRAIVVPFMNVGTLKEVQILR